jgi:hypothetical protein
MEAAEDLSQGASRRCLERQQFAETQPTHMQLEPRGSPPGQIPYAAEVLIAAPMAP